MTWGATVGNAMPGRGAIGGETLAVLDRLEILGEAVLLNDDLTSSWNFNAAADQVNFSNHISDLYHWYNVMVKCVSSIEYISLL
jgi:hypothetical protein